MGHVLPPPPAASEGRIARSSRLLRVAWRLVRDDRAMLTLAACGVAAMVAAGLAFVWFAGLPSGDVRSYGGLLLGVTVALFPATFVGTFLGVAVAAAADAALRGERLTVREALAVSRRRVRQIAGWSVLAAGVGALLSALAERLPFGDRLAAWALGGAWDLLTMFALPVLALEGRAAPGCVRRSASLLRDRWGEGVAGTVTITAATTAATLPIAVVLMGGLTLSIFAPGPGLALTVVATAALAAVIAVSGVLRQVFAVALYRYAADGVAPGGFPEEDLRAPFTRRRA